MYSFCYVIYFYRYIMYSFANLGILIVMFMYYCYVCSVLDIPFHCVVLCTVCV